MLKHCKLQKTRLLNSQCEYLRIVFNFFHLKEWQLIPGKSFFLNWPGTSFLPVGSHIVNVLFLACIESNSSGWAICPTNSKLANILSWRTLRAFWQDTLWIGANKVSGLLVIEGNTVRVDKGLLADLGAYVAHLQFWLLQIIWRNAMEGK